MKKRVKYLAAGLLTAGLLVGAGYALTAEDSLVTLSYVTDKFVPAAVERGNKAGGDKLQEAYDAGTAELDKVQKELHAMGGREEGVLYSAALTPMDCHDGEAFELTTGCSLLMQEGVAVVTHNGAFIDATDGKELSSGSSLTMGHRYLTGENTTAKVEVMSGAARLGVQSEYRRSGGKKNPMPFYDVSRLDWYYPQVSYVYEHKFFEGVSAHEFGPGVLMNRAMVMTVFYKMAGLPQGEMDAAAHISFKDVPENAWYASFVKWGFDQGITSGTGPDTFNPDDLISREQFVQLLYNFATNYLGKNLPQRGSLDAFKDKDDVSGWATEAVSWGVATGLLKSMTGAEMHLLPQGFNDRAAIAVMLHTFGMKVG